MMLSHLHGIRGMLRLSAGRVRVLGAGALCAVIWGCASAGQGAAGGSSGGGAATPADPAASTMWPIKTREHVDLWLHGYAMLQDDTAQVPFFRRGYRDELQVLKNRGNAITLLDANREKLRARLNTNRTLFFSQFLALYFGSWDDLRQVVKLFLEAEGNPRAAKSQEVFDAFVILAGYFPAPADQEWLRLYVASLEDESAKFYHSYWLAEQRARTSAIAATDSLWQRVYRPKLQNFLDKTQQGSGSFLLSVPLNGEGRTIKQGRTANFIATTSPAGRENAVEPIYVFAHEAIAALTATAVNDNITPNDRRSGLADRLTSAGAVQGGLILLERTAPELADGYARYYLRSANASAGSDPRASLRAVFPLPAGIGAAIGRQLDIVLGGI